MTGARLPRSTQLQSAIHLTADPSRFVTLVTPAHGALALLAGTNHLHELTRPALRGI